MTILQVVFDPECGTAVPDARAKSFVQGTVDAWLARKDAKFMTIIVGTEMMFDAFRLHYLKNLTLPEDKAIAPASLSWTFWYKDTLLELNNQGVITTPHDSLQVAVVEECLCENARLHKERRVREGIQYPSTWKDREA